MGLNFDALKAAVQTVADGQAKLAADQAQDAADIVAAITKLGSITVDPADQATVDSVTAALQSVADSQKSSAAGLEQSSADLEKAIA